MTDPAASGSAAAPARAASAKLIAIAVAAASAGVLAWSTFSHRWAVSADPDAHGGFGLRSVEACDVDGCHTVANGHVASGAFPAFGWVVSVALWIAAAALLLSAGLALAGRFVYRPMAPTTLALLGVAIGLISGCVFIATCPGRPLTGVGPTFWIFGAAAIGGLVASIVLGRLRPSEPEWDDPQPVDEDNW